MYDYANKYNNNKEELSKKYNDEYNTMSNKPPIFQNETDNIFNKLKEETFIKLFKDLDSDYDDIISSCNVKTKHLPQEINKIIYPLITELRDENETLNKDEFVRAMYHLFEVNINT